MTKKHETIIERNKSIYGIDFAAGMSKAFLIASGELTAEREKAAKLVEALEDIAKNFDCDKDAHRYNTTCRCCLAKQSLTEYKKQKEEIK